MEYNFPEIEKKWQKRWKENGTYRTEENNVKEKFYVLDMFPYPSGAGLHVGHPLGYIASDIIARYKRHLGKNVLHPMGYDSFGLPAEQYAIQTGLHPAVTTSINIDGCLDSNGNILSNYLNVDGTIKNKALIDKNVPTAVTDDNYQENIIKGYRKQLDKIGFAFDWDREVRTSDANYYRWTQWIFKLIYNSWFNKDTSKAESIDELIKQFELNGNYNINAVIEDDWFTKVISDSAFQAFFSKNWEGDFTATDWKSLTEVQQQKILMQYRIAYHADSWVNWCSALGTVLANDEVKDGKSERGGHPVEQKRMRQWSMRITAYAQRLLDGLDTIDWPENIKEVQRNWIGRSEGALVSFDVVGKGEKIPVFTTRPDTIFGVSFVTLAPEHDLVLKITTPEYRTEIDAYIASAKLKTERDRQSDVKNVTGQFTGAFVAHPFTGENVPVWIGEYVLVGYGTGAVMAVPCGDQRDWDFATKFGLPIPNILEGIDISEKANPSKDLVLCNSDFLNGLTYKTATRKVIEEMEAKGIGEGKINYRMRDAVFSRQRYWGEPFPVYYKQTANGDEIPYLCEDDDLPIVLPTVDKYLPTESGEPPLARAKGWSYEENAPHPQPLFGGEGGDSVSAKWDQWQTSNKEIWERIKKYARTMRKEPTKTEEIIWTFTRNNNLDHKIRRQHPFKEFIVDFICLDRRLAIEIDGGGHLDPDQKAYNEARSLYLGFLGIKTIRFTNDEVLADSKSVTKTIKEELDKRPSIKDNASAGSALSSEEGSGVRPDYRLEYNTMPGWAGSSWYFLRYMDPNNHSVFASREKVDYWNQVDLYMGGAEHATGHLLYSRFWTKVLFDHGYIGFDEPFKKMINQGMILGRSSLVYRLQFVNRDPRKSEFDTIDTNYFYLSKEHFDRIVNATYSPLDIKLLILENFGEDVHSQISDFAGFQTYILHADISLVENDVLDIDRFRKLHKENNNSYFLQNENDKYICGSEIEKMSKSKYNVQTPDELVEKFGADTLRMYEMFLGPVEQSKPWDTKGINGVHNFLRKYWRLTHDKENNFFVSNDAPSKSELKTLHTAIKKVTEDLDRFSWNTVVSTLMICVNELTDQKCNKRKIIESLNILLSPYAPHMAEETWEKLGHTTSVTEAMWPVFDQKHLQEDAFDYPISFNGKTRFFVSLPIDMPQAEVEDAVRGHEQTPKYLEGKEIKKVIVVPKRIVNVVV